MSVLSWILISFVSILIVIIGYAGVMGKSIFSYKHRNDKQKPQH